MVKKVDLAAFFTEGFEKKDWLNVSKMDLPVYLKYLGHDEFESRFGKTTRYTFEDKDGTECRLLCKGNTFRKAIEQFVSAGNVLRLNKDAKHYWVFDEVRKNWS